MRLLSIGRLRTLSGGGKAECCLQYHKPLASDKSNWLHLIIAPDQVDRLHFTCYQAWRERRGLVAIEALAIIFLTPHNLTPCYCG